MSYLIYRGPSLIDRAPIFAALTGIEIPSSNPKTGPMAQIWVLRDDIPPIEAVHTGQDVSVCGDCKLRGDGTGKQRSCYVQVWQAPNNVFKHRHKLKPAPPKIYDGRAIRFGAYGEVSVIPVHLVADIHRRAKMTTGYTHQWKTTDPEFKHYLMASCDSVEERELAKEKGWATFRIKQPHEFLEAGEVLCPASKEAGMKKQCITCGLCAGVRPNGKSIDVVINVHGAGQRHFGGVT
jgi:ferredoxin